MSRKNLNRLILALLCVVSYIVSGKENVKMTISDTCFLIGIACLTVGLARIVKRTGFFFFPQYGIRQFIVLITNAKRPRKPIGESYEDYIRATDKKMTSGTPLAIALAALGVSAALALL